MLERVQQPIRPTPGWGERALCLRESPSLFFGTDSIPLTGQAANPGRAVCAVCPVARDCLIDALREEEFVGLRAGFLGNERRNTLKAHHGSIESAMAAYDAGTFKTSRRRS
jgi:WhiB family redox-sensing transcriptional regulator